MIETGSNKHNPALSQLEVLVGDWVMELSNASFLASPSETVQGQVSFEWQQEGAFLVMRMGRQTAQSTCCDLAHRPR